MRYKYYYILVLLLVGFSSLAHAGDLELYVSNEALQLDYINDINLMELDQNKLSFGFFFDKDRDIIVNTGLLMPVLPEDKLQIPLTFSIGAKAYVALISEPQKADVMSLAPGVGIRFDIPIDIGMPMYIDANFFYAPEILTFGDAVKAKDFTARFEVNLLSRLAAFIGYRLLRYDMENTGWHDLDDAFHIGARYRF